MVIKQKYTIYVDCLRYKNDTPLSKQIKAVHGYHIETKDMF